MIRLNNTNSPNASPTTVREANDGNLTVVHGSDATIALTVEPSGTTITAANAAVTKEKGDARYPLKSAVESTYLPITAAADTYLAQADAADTYLPIATAASTYLPIATAAATYLPITTATSTYLPITTAAATYLAQDDAADTYLAQDDAASTYLPITTAASTYLAQAGGPLTGLVSITRAGQDMIRLDNTNSPNANPTTVRESNDGDFVVVHGSDAAIALTIEPAGTTITAPTAAVTRQKGDARYLQSTTAASTYLPITTAASTYLPIADVPRKFYNSEASLAAAVGGLDDGTFCDVNGCIYVVDSSATGWKSALSHRGVDGVRAEGMPSNMFIGACHDLEVPRTIRLFVSADGERYSLLTPEPLLTTTGAELTGGNPSLQYHDGFWYIAAQTGVLGSYDFIVYKSRDLLGAWTRYNCNLGPTPVGSAITPMPGGSQPANYIWGTSLIIEPDGTAWVHASVRYGNDVLDDYGNTVKHFKTYAAECNSLDDMTFDTAVAVDLGTTLNMIDPDVTELNGTYYLTIKDEISKDIRVYTGASVEGPWTYEYDVSDPVYKIEGSCIVPVISNPVSGAATATYRMYVEGHNRIDGVRSTIMRVFSGTDPDTDTWATPEYVVTSYPMRHGKFLNLGYMDRSAMRSVIASVSAMSGIKPKIPDINIGLDDGASDIVPQECAVYIASADKDCQVTLYESGATRFYMLVGSALNACGITLLAAGNVPREFVIGYGKNEDIYIEFKKRPNGDYYPIGLTSDFNDNGIMNLNGLPTSSAGLSSGDGWNDSGTLKIV
jgi:hypothetical protein